MSSLKTADKNDKIYVSACLKFLSSYPKRTTKKFVLSLFFNLCELSQATSGLKSQVLDSQMIECLRMSYTLP